MCASLVLAQDNEVLIYHSSNHHLPVAPPLLLWFLQLRTVKQCPSHLRKDQGMSLAAFNYVLLVNPCPTTLNHNEYYSIMFVTVNSDQPLRFPRARQRTMSRWMEKPPPLQQKLRLPGYSRVFKLGSRSVYFFVAEPQRRGS